MKKLNVFISSIPLIGILLILFVSCKNEIDPSYEKKQIEKSGVHINGTVNLEGCEYYVVGTYYGYCTLVHKGNCKNPIHYSKN